MLIQGKDGELRIYEFGTSSSTHYFEVLFCEMDFSGPTSRPRTDETLIMNRGLFDSNAHFIQSNEEPRYAPLNISFSCRLADTVNTRILSDWLHGQNIITNAAGGSTTIYTWDGQTTPNSGGIDGNILKAFADTNKMSYRLEVLWDTNGQDIGYRYDEVYFPPGEQTITESADGLVLTANGKVYSGVTRLDSFWSGVTLRAFV